MKFFSVVLVSLFVGVRAHGASTVTFDNQSGQSALVKVVGPTSASVTVNNGSKETLEVLPGHYFIKIRYGAEGRFSYSKGDEFDVTETASRASAITITLAKIIGGNYGSKQISQADFDTETISGARTASKPRWEGTIEQRRKAIGDAGQRKSQGPEVVQDLIETMAVTEAESGSSGASAASTPSSLDSGSGNLQSAKTRPVLVGACADALVAIGEPAFRPVLAGLQHQNRWVRIGCAWVLGRLGNKECVPPLCDVLPRAKADYALFCMAVSSLQELADPASLPQALKVLEASRGDPDVAGQLLMLVSRVDGRVGLDWCKQLAESKEPPIRQDVARSAAYLSDAESRAILERLLGDNEPFVRGQAAGALGRRKEKSTVARLEALATNSSEHGFVRVKAAWALARMGDEVGMKVLREVAAGQDKARAQDAERSIQAIASNEPTNTGLNPRKFTSIWARLEDGTYVRVE